MSVPFHVIIPARYHSSRLPGKLLMELDGMTILERVFRQALKARPQTVMIATDHEEIVAKAKAFGAPVMMTSPSHASGTDRLAEVVKNCDFKAEDIVVNVQGDEPLIAPELIAQVAESLAGAQSSIATLCWPVETLATALNPNVVKVVRDVDNYALYFSRSFIPFQRDNPDSLQFVFRHIGLYAYRAAFLDTIVGFPPCHLEQAEALEQLRMLWHGYKIKVDKACRLPLQDINTVDDLEKARLLLQQQAH